MTPTPNEPFVPLSAGPSRPGNPEAHFVQIVSQPGPMQSFKPLTSDHPSSQPFTKACDPRVSIQRSGDQVTGIRIHCGCGQVIDLACIY
jgi:hypothetical protein